jgi:hypothetical protein
MGNDRLIAEVARVWVDGRGDADGIAWCATRLRDAVQAEIDRRADEDKARAEIAASKAAFVASEASKARDMLWADGA